MHRQQEKDKQAGFNLNPRSVDKFSALSYMLYAIREALGS